MTSDQIKNSNNLDSQYFWIWLKECAYQLAVMNEQYRVDLYKNLAQSLGSTVPPDSESALRGDASWQADWTCSNCNHVNFPVRRSCRNCGLKHSESARGVRVGSQPASGLPTPDLAGSQNSKTEQWDQFKNLYTAVRDSLKVFEDGPPYSLPPYLLDRLRDALKADQSLGSTVPPDSESALREKCSNCSHHPDAKPLSKDNAKCLYCSRAVYLATFYVMDGSTRHRADHAPDPAVSLHSNPEFPPKL
jgi:hypothetical protein